MNKILPGCSAIPLQKSAEVFFKKFLHHDVDKRYQNTHAVLVDPLFKIRDGSTEELIKLVKDIPQKIIDTRNTSCPYIFDFISDDEYNSLKVSKANNEREGSLDMATNLTLKGKAFYNEVKNLIGEENLENIDDSKVFQGYISKALG